MPKEFFAPEPGVVAYREYDRSPLDAGQIRVKAE